MQNLFPHSFLISSYNFISTKDRRMEFVSAKKHIKAPLKTADKSFLHRLHVSFHLKQQSCNIFI